MLERRRHLKETIKTQNKQIHNREKLICSQRAEIRDWKEENRILFEQCRDLRSEVEELELFKDRIRRLANSNTYNNEKAILNKIKELVNDFDSNY